MWILKSHSRGYTAVPAMPVLRSHSRGYTAVPAMPVLRSHSRGYTAVPVMAMPRSHRSQNISVHQVYTAVHLRTDFRSVISTRIEIFLFNRRQRYHGRYRIGISILHGTHIIRLWRLHNAIGQWRDGFGAGDEDRIMLLRNLGR